MLAPLRRGIRLDRRPLVATLTVLAIGCGGESSPQPVVVTGEPHCAALTLHEAARPRDVVLLVNDTWRRDFLGPFDGAAETPRLDAFASESLVFDHAFTQAPWTKPSIATLFTSLHPSQHGVATSPQRRDPTRRKGQGGLVEADVLASSLPTLAERMQAGGLRTAAFTTNPWLESRFGFGQGFEVYDDSFARWGADGEAVFRAGLAWIDGLEPGDHYFLYLHTIDTHRPYGRLAPGAESTDRNRLNDTRPLVGEEARSFAGTIRLADGRRALEAGFLPTEGLVRESYARGVETFDTALGGFLDALRRRDPERWAETAVIVTSDHGEALYERGYGNHGLGLFDDEAAIPLVARLPGVEPATGHVDCLVGLVDLMPSLCTYLGLPCPDTMQGWSFLRRPEQPTADGRRFLVTEGVMDAPDDRSIRNARYKLVRKRDERGATVFSLYDLEADPEERRDRARPALRTRESRRALEVLQEQLPAAVEALPPTARETAPVDPELRGRLEALGYTADPG